MARVPIGKTHDREEDMHPSNSDSYVMASRPRTWAKDFELVVGESAAPKVARQGDGRSASLADVDRGRAGTAFDQLSLFRSTHTNSRNAHAVVCSLHETVPGAS